jgi:alpha-1,2-glucosyltransferase
MVPEYTNTTVEPDTAKFDWRGALADARSVLGWRPVAFALMAMFLVAQSVWLSDLTVLLSPYSDESVHMQQIQNYCAGGREQNVRLTMFPGVHALAATVGTAFGDCSWKTVRRFETVMGLAATALALGVLLSLNSQFPIARALQFYYFPIAFPFQFLVFTDVPALACSIAALLSMVRRRWLLASMFATLAIGLRQTNVVVPLFVSVIALLQHDKTGRIVAWVFAYLRKVWLNALALAAFALFVWYNGGVAVGDRGRHAVGFHVGNVYFALALSWFIALPINLENLWKYRAKLASYGFVAALVIAFVVYLVWFKVDHPFNMKTRVPFLRNQVLLWVRASVVHQALFFIPIALGFASVWVTALVSKRYWPLYVVGLITLLPERLIESRYAILPIAFWSLLRRDGSASAERASVLSNAAIGLWLIYVILQGRGL